MQKICSPMSSGPACPCAPHCTRARSASTSSTRSMRRCCSARAIAERLVRDRRRMSVIRPYRVAKKGIAAIAAKLISLALRMRSIWMSALSICTFMLCIWIMSRLDRSPVTRLMMGLLASSSYFASTRSMGPAVERLSSAPPTSGCSLSKSSSMRSRIARLSRSDARSASSPAAKVPCSSRRICPIGCTRCSWKKPPTLAASCPVQRSRSRLPLSRLCAATYAAAAPTAPLRA
mmetsp:Transcript_8932/g.22644  ORF Transcript_8932/g.22644 Transcript_8932/m.22644 type:complete len:233 (+) Transcript_8932:131-829(+)